MKEQIITKNDSGQRIDKYLHKLLMNASTGFLFKMMRKKNITLNKKKATGKEVLKEGDRIQIFFSDETYDKMCGKAEKNSYFEELSGCSFEHVHVIYEDEDILVLNKPVGILSQKSKEGDVSLNEEMLSYLIHTGELTEESFRTFHPSVSNRLDRNTSGIILAGKTLHGQQYLSGCLNDRSIKKLYHCIVHGEVNSPDSLDGYLSKDENNMVHLSKEKTLDAKRIKTEYRPLASSKRLSKLEVHLITGRTHQIRAHLASIGHGILGDPKYGDIEKSRMVLKDFNYRFQLLHAYSVTFPDGREFVAQEPPVFHKIEEKYFR
ncbi:MAG: RluA family pseudouridine synthase [Lachnospiraceae bacterium]|nr:RluA family pseudouridine synthase [Lachnospiraceae bacterium]